jgi:LuxR family maltose regulon positive regulatory protein
MSQRSSSNRWPEGASGRPPGPPRPARATTAGLLSTKLNPPVLQPHQVVREALNRQVLQSGSARLVLVRAPAGFGKTTAMVQARQALADAGTDTAWLTLDRADNDLPRFLRGLHQALLEIVVDAPAGEAPLDLLQALAAHDAPFVLFLDDFELISEPAVLGLVREMLDRLPRGGRLVLGSRSLPELGLGRLRAAGQLLEIDAEGLRFSLDETRRFFALRHPASRMPGGAARVASEHDLLRHLPELHRKTEGWIAALWLASMALDAVLARRGSVADFIVQFSGSNRAVADYLAEDVLARQAPELRDFLLRTSILRHLNAPLCQLLNPKLDAPRILDLLDRSNLFLTPLAGGDDGAAAGERAWRYHSLFADFLRAQLAREQPHELARLHLAASGWYEAVDRPVPAIDHAIEGGDMPHALHLLSRHALEFLAQGRMRLLGRWFSAMPAALLREQPLLQMVSLWASLFTRGPWDTMAQLEASGCGALQDAAVQAHVNALRPMLLAMTDRTDEALQLGRRQLARLPTHQPFADAVLANAMAHLMSTMGDSAPARRLLDAARRGQHAQGFNHMYSVSIEGLIDLQQGRLRQATARFRIALGATAGSSYLPTHGNAWAGVLYAGVLYEAHQLPQAEQLLNVYLPLARDVGLPDHMVQSHAMRARIAFLHGDIDAVLHTLDELETLGHHRQLPRVVASARLERARILLMQGQHAAAAEELARADDTAVWARVAARQLNAHELDDMAIGRLRWQALAGDAEAAADALARAVTQAQAKQRLRRAYSLQVLQALAEQRAGRSDRAAALVGAMLPTLCGEGFVRLLLDAGPGIAALLRRTRTALHLRGAADPLHDDYLAQLVRLCAEARFNTIGADASDAADSSHAGSSLDSDERGVSAAAGGWATTTLAAQRSGPPDDPAMAPAEALTRKEVRVLQLLAEGYSNSAMAEKLFVSDSTVRTHLRSINLKLGARSRTQAVALARRAGVIG